MQVEELIESQLANVENHLDFAWYLAHANQNGYSENSTGLEDLEKLEIMEQLREDLVSEHGQEVEPEPPS